MCETYMLTYMDHILKALYSGIYDKQHIYGYIYVFFIYVPYMTVPYGRDRIATKS